MPPPNGGGRCEECEGGSVECGDDPRELCDSGSSPHPYRFLGTTWFPVEAGVDAAIRVYGRTRFLHDDNGDLIFEQDPYTKVRYPRHITEVWLDLPFRTACVYQGRCERPMKPEPVVEDEATTGRERARYSPPKRRKKG
jgi:hypothetical protein